MDIDGQVALVTGGASGLGEATVRRLAELGADVAILDRDADLAAGVAASVGGYSQHCDVTDAESVAAGVSAAMARFGQAPRIVVCCAGTGLAAPVVDDERDVSIDLFRRVVEIELFGTYHAMSYAVQAMVELPELEGGERGVIVNVASAAYQDGQAGHAAGAASAGAVASMCLPAARELARFGIRVVAIAPGLFRTPMMEALPAATAAGIVGGIPFPPRPGEPAEFARLAADIVGNPYLNGTVIRLDGAVRLPAR